MKHKSRVFQVDFGYTAISASWIDVLKWLVTFGRKGKTHTLKKNRTPMHVNCRSACREVEFVRPKNCIECLQIIGNDDTTCTHCGGEQ